MRSIRPELTSELFSHFGNPRDTKVAKGQAYKITSFRRLVELTAGLAFKNKDHLLFYRGQNTDYRNKAGASSFFIHLYIGEIIYHNKN